MSSAASPSYSPRMHVTFPAVLKWLAVAGLAILGLMAYVLTAGRYVNYSEATFTRYWPERGWLITHILGGTIALFTGPTQFFTGLRRKRMKLHRLLGKIYLGGVAIGSAAAFYLSCKTAPQVSWNFSVSLFLLAVAWSSSTAMAFVAIRNRNVEVHKEWMIRSYVVTYAFVSFRLLYNVPVFAAIPLPERLGLMGWMCWAPPLLFTEIALQWKRTVRAAR